MSEGGDIEVESPILSGVLPKDVVKEVGNIKLFNKWDYDVEVRDISLTYVQPETIPAKRQRNHIFLRLDAYKSTSGITSHYETPYSSLTPPVDMPLSGSARPTARSSSD